MFATETERLAIHGKTYFWDKRSRYINIRIIANERINNENFSFRGLSISLFLKFLYDTSTFCGATDTPVLNFWWRLLWVSKPGWISRLHASPQIHLWCDTCWLYRGQHGSRSRSLHATEVAAVGCQLVNNLMTRYSKLQSLERKME